MRKSKNIAKPVLTSLQNFANQIRETIFTANKCFTRRSLIKTDNEDAIGLESITQLSSFLIKET